MEDVEQEQPQAPLSRNAALNASQLTTAVN